MLLCSLRTGWLDGFFYDLSHGRVQAFDYFPVPRAGSNLLQGLSAFDTFRSGYGPYATWFIYHPVSAVLLGVPLALLKPWTSYWLWTAVSAALAVVALVLLIRGAEDRRFLPAVTLLMLGSFPMFLTLYVGNMQNLLLLALTMIFVALDTLRRDAPGSRTHAMLLAGLLLSLFTKPAVLLMLPLLLLLRGSRRAVLQAAAVYLAASLLCFVIPSFNPESIGWAQRGWLFLHPETVKETVNVYRNGFVLTASMKDNAAHWLSMLALSDYRLRHIDIMSLPVWIDEVSGAAVPTVFYRIPVLLVLEVSTLMALVRSRSDRLHAALYTAMASSLLVFLSYGIAWEYSYTALFPIAALLLLRDSRSRIDRMVIACSIPVWLPSIFFLLHGRDASAISTQLLVAGTRVIPVAVSFVLLLSRAVGICLRSREGLRWLTAVEIVPGPAHDA